MHCEKVTTAGFGIAHFYSSKATRAWLQLERSCTAICNAFMSLLPQELRLGPIPDSEASRLLPPILHPLMRAAQRGDDVAPVALAIAKSFGFDGFWYGVSLSLRPSQEAQIYVYSTWPEALTRLYDERAYVELDPRIHDALVSVLPVVWDQATYRGRSRKVDGFLDVMQAQGIASGLMCSLRDVHNRIAALTLSSSIPLLDEVRRLSIGDQLGNMLMFQRYFHELYVRGILNNAVPPYLQGHSLSARELQCLRLSAEGLNGEQIGRRLSIAAGTVQNHFNSMRSKLGATNRTQVIHIAAQLGLLSA